MDTLEIDDINRSRLALQFPAFVCEVKLDGERILSHINRGIVTMQVCFRFFLFAINDVFIICGSPI